MSPENFMSPEANQLNKIPSKISEAESACLALEATEKDIYLNDSKIAGLSLRVTPAGKKIWQFRYSVKIGESWKSKRTSLGPFRKNTKDKNYIAEGLTVNEARNTAQELKANIKVNNTDPNEAKQKKAKKRLEEKQQAEKEKLKLITLDDLFDRWDKVALSKHKDGGASVREIIKSKVLNKYGKLPAQDFSKTEIMSITDALLADNKQRMAKLTFSLIRQMMRFAETRDIIENDPTHKIDKKQIGGSSIERDRVLCATDDKPDELKDLLSKIPNSGLNDTSKAGLYICLATCCRIGELLKAKWEHVDLEARYWLIPEENSKNGKPHSIYLNDFAIEYFKLLREISGWSIWLYPSTKNIDGKTIPVGTRTITKQVCDRQREDGGNLKNRTKKSQSLILGNGRWTPHDLRRTGASLMVELGVMPEVVERCLNHTEENKVKRIYQRYSYKSEMKAGWELLGNRLRVLRDGGDNVVTLKKKTQKAL